MRPIAQESVNIDLPLFSVKELPSVIRYYDEFTDKYCSIAAPVHNKTWVIIVGGQENTLEFGKFPSKFCTLLKHWTWYLIQNMAPATVAIRFRCLQDISEEDLNSIIYSSPRSARSTWQLIFSKEYKSLHLASLKSLLHFLCVLNVGEWSSEYLNFLSSLPIRTLDKYASVRTGDVFLSVDEEGLLVTHFDVMSHIVTSNPRQISNSELRDVAILICSFQFGLRPMQIGMLQVRDVRIWNNADRSPPSVHLTFKMVKQRSQRKSLPLTRKVKHDWAPLFVELYNRALGDGLSGTDRIFRTKSSKETAQFIIKATGKLLPESRSATELRHTAAQRLVDAGASHEELAEFMGHSDIDTGLVYFQTSPNQAERVNQALGISEIYQQVAKIAHDRFISLSELAELKGEQQIGGAPHALDIVGIGGCAIGQPACPSNPIMACYGCRKFMPLNDVQIHKKVLSDFRSVVTSFSESSRNDPNTPTILQLKRTISNVQGIIAEIERGLG